MTLVVRIHTTWTSIPSLQPVAMPSVWLCFFCSLETLTPGLRLAAFQGTWDLIDWLIDWFVSLSRWVTLSLTGTRKLIAGMFVASWLHPQFLPMYWIIFAMTQETFGYLQHYKMFAAVRIDGKTYERTTTDRERDGRIDRQADIMSVRWLCHVAHVLLCGTVGARSCSPLLISCDPTSLIPRL